jgi:hypothetical protein
VACQFMHEEDAMGRVCRTHGEEDCIQDLGEKARRKETTRTHAGGRIV